ncbi:MAG: mannitol dehydrogenase family protein, partial [Actinomycetota bacterium]
VTEPFRQWMVEDRFVGSRPSLEDVGVLVTEDVEPYERMKLRLLNAGHSCLAYLAAIRGYETVDEAMADPDLRSFIGEFLNLEARPALPPVPGIDLDEYCSSLLERFANPQIGDQISRLCLDGTSKFPKFLLPTIREQLRRGGPIALGALALAAWCEYLHGRTEDGAALPPAPDPLLEDAKRHAEAARSDPAAFLGFSQVFGDDLAEPGRFRDAFVAAVEALRTSGVASTIRSGLRASAPG